MFLQAAVTGCFRVRVYPVSGIVVDGEFCIIQNVQADIAFSFGRQTLVLHITEHSLATEEREGWGKYQHLS